MKKQNEKVSGRKVTVTTFPNGTKTYRVAGIDLEFRSEKRMMEYFTKMGLKKHLMGYLPTAPEFKAYKGR